MLELGMQARVLKESIEGTISKIEEDKIWIDVDGMDFPFDPKEVIGIGANNEVVRHGEKKSEMEQLFEAAAPSTDPIKRAEEAQEKEELISVDFFGKKNKKGIPEIDLHFDEIYKGNDKLKSGEKLNYQITYLNRVLKSAKDLKIPKFVVIHGVGKGKLRSEILDYLYQQQNIEFSDAPFNIYGQGAVEIKVYISQLEQE